MFTLAAWWQSVNPAGAFVALNAVPDQILHVQGANIQVPSLAQVIALAAGIESTVAQQGRFNTPSRRTLSLERVTPTNAAAAADVIPESPHRLMGLADVPLVLVAGEQATFEINSNPAAPHAQWGLAWFADGPPAPIKGAIFTVRVTGATAQVAGTWSLVPLTFAEDLPRGRYQLVGLRVQAPTLVAARVVFVGTGAQGWRPGVLGCQTDHQLEYPDQRLGRWGVFGEFEDTDPPQLECLSNGADPAQVAYLDLIQIRAGAGGA